MVTESNAEAYMDVISGYLTLVAFDPPFAAGSSELLVPAFPAIYGGALCVFTTCIYPANHRCHL